MTSRVTNAATTLKLRNLAMKHCILLAEYPLTHSLLVRILHHLPPIFKPLAESLSRCDLLRCEAMRFHQLNKFTGTGWVDTARDKDLWETLEELFINCTSGYEDLG